MQATVKFSIRLVQKRGHIEAFFSETVLDSESNDTLHRLQAFFFGADLQAMASALLLLHHMEPWYS